jgi:hypothetical protein
VKWRGETEVMKFEDTTMEHAIDISEKPIMVIRYHKGKMLGRFIFAWGPIAFISIVMMNRAIDKSSITMFIVFSIMLLGVINYHVILLNMKELLLYKDHIVCKKRFVFDDKIIDMHNAVFSFCGGWLEEILIINSLKRNKSTILFVGYIGRSDFKKYIEGLSQVTGKTPEYLSSGWNKYYFDNPNDKGEKTNG